MFKVIVASLVFGSTSTVTMIEVYKWNQLDMTHGQGEQQVAEVASNEELKNSSMQYFESSDTQDYIRYLRVNLDYKNNLDILKDEKVPGRWRERDYTVGAKIYYETISVDGEILSTGSRPDPREFLLSSADRRKGVTFVLTIPWERYAEKINLYSVNHQGHKQIQHELIGSYHLASND